MAQHVNEYGLPRRLPSDVRRTLRQEAGFGCVKCGFAFCEYEHIDPEFPDATKHDSAKMAFLCKRCHGEVTAGVASKDSVWKAKANPFCKREKPAWKGNLEFGNLNSSLGSMMFLDCRVLLRVLGDDLLTIDPPEEKGGPIRVNAKLYDGPKPSLEIEDNAITIGSENWDVEIVGDLLTVRRALGEPSLIYRFVPKAGIRIERVAMEYKGTKVNVTEGRVVVGGNGCEITAISAMFQDCDTCIVATREGFYFGDEPRPAKQPFFGRNIALRDCKIDGGLHVRAGSRINLINCWIDRGIRIDNGAVLQLVAGVVSGVHPKS
jgi:hypothetical protein